MLRCVRIPLMNPAVPCFKIADFSIGSCVSFFHPSGKEQMLRPSKVYYQAVIPTLSPDLSATLNTA